MESNIFAYKLQCLNTDECGAVEYFEQIPDSYICDNCGQPALPYTKGANPFIKKDGMTFEKYTMTALKTLIHQMKEN
jgi:hypothetical protein